MPAPVGHNSGDAPSSIYGEDDVITGAAQKRLESFVERAMRLLDDRDAVTADLGEVFAEAKGEGFDAKYIRKIVALKRKDKMKLKQEKEMLMLYASALGCEDLV